jgi:hypothetical protein
MTNQDVINHFQNQNPNHYFAISPARRGIGEGEREFRGLNHFTVGIADKGIIKQISVMVDLDSTTGRKMVVFENQE